MTAKLVRLMCMSNCQTEQPRAVARDRTAWHTTVKDNVEDAGSNSLTQRLMRDTPPQGPFRWLR